MDDEPDVKDIIIDLQDHASDALGEIGEPGAEPAHRLRDEYDAFTRVANWLADRYRVDVEPR
jgi:hypothetical protein